MRFARDTQAKLFSPVCSLFPLGYLISVFPFSFLDIVDDLEIFDVHDYSTRGIIAFICFSFLPLGGTNLT